LGARRRVGACGFAQPVKHQCVAFYRPARSGDYRPILQVRNGSRETFGDSLRLTHLLAVDRTKANLEVSYDEQDFRILRICRYDRSFLRPRTRTFSRRGERTVFRYPGCGLYPLFTRASRMPMADRSIDRCHYILLGGSVRNRLRLRGRTGNDAPRETLSQEPERRELALERSPGECARRTFKPKSGNCNRASRQERYKADRATACHAKPTPPR
jgi:hypothetical protein